MASATDTRYDLVLRGSRVIDPARKLDDIRDVAIRDGKIAAVKADIAPTRARETVDVSGKLVFPGLIDPHAHVYEYVTGPFGINAEVAGVRSGVTTLIDQGTANAFTFAGFRKYVVEQASARVYAFLSIYSAGALYGYLNTRVVAPDMVDLDVVIETIRANRDVIKGVKVQVEAGTYSHWGLETFELARTAARKTKVPIYAHLGHIFPLKKGEKVDPAAIIRAALPRLAAGDIIAHPFTQDPGCFLSEDGIVYPEIRDAIKRGVKIDVGRGTNFNFETARKVLGQGILPDTLGIDLHGFNIRPSYRLNTRKRHVKAGLAKARPTGARKTAASEPDNDIGHSLAHAMTSMLALGVPFDHLARMVTVNPARMIGMDKELGALRVGRAADVSVFDLEIGRWTLRDFAGNEVVAEQRFVPDFVLCGGVRYAADIRVHSHYEEPVSAHLIAAE